MALLGVVFVSALRATEPLEPAMNPFDFDNYRRTPLQARQTQVPWSSKDSNDLQRGLLSGERGKKQSLSDKAAALFPNPEEIPVHQERAPLPSPSQLTDEITAASHGMTTKGQRDLLARSRTSDQLRFSSMSESEYELYATRYQARQERVQETSGEGLLRPLPTVINSKTGGPPHAYAVSQAGIGSRTEPRDNQNPLDDVIRFLRLDRPVTKGTDPLPSPSARLTAASTPAPIPPPTSSQGTPSLSNSAGDTP